MSDKTFRFTADMFGGLAREFWFPEVLHRANALLEAHEKTLPEVYLGYNSTQIGEIPCWYETPSYPNKYSARLWNVQKIGEEK